MSLYLSHCGASSPCPANLRQPRAPPRPPPPSLAAHSAAGSASPHLHHLRRNRFHPVLGDAHAVVAVHQGLDDPRAGMAVPQHLRRERDAQHCPGAPSCLPQPRLLRSCSKPAWEAWGTKVSCPRRPNPLLVGNARAPLLQRGGLSQHSTRAPRLQPRPHSLFPGAGTNSRPRLGCTSPSQQLCLTRSSTAASSP